MSNLQKPYYRVPRPDVDLPIVRIWIADVALYSQPENAEKLNPDMVFEVSKNKMRPQSVQSFFYNKIDKGIGTFSFTLIDSEWTKIEQQIAASNNRILFQYGRVNHAVSPITRGLLTSVKIIPQPEALIIYAEGFASGWEIGADQFYTSSGGKKISAFIRELIKEIKIEGTNTLLFDESKGQVVIEPTLDNLDLDIIDSTELATNIKINSGNSLLQFLNSKLVPSLNERSNADIKCYIEGNVFYFHTPAYFAATMAHQAATKTDTTQTSSTPSDTTKRNRRIYSIFSDRETDVIAYTPDTRIGMVNYLGGASTKTVGMNAYTAEYMVEEATPSSNPNRALLGGGNLVFRKPEKGKAGNIAVTNASNDSSIKQEVEQEYWKNFSNPILAELQLIGDPTIKLFDIVEIDMIVPKGQFVGTKYWLSGTFFVLDIQESIDNGQYVSTLTIGMTGVAPIDMPEPMVGRVIK